MGAHFVTKAGWKMKTEKRKTFVAREDLLQKINEIAKRNGLSMYESINEVFDLAIQASEKGISLRTSIQEQSTLRRAREKGFVLELENLWYEMAELAYQGDREKALDAWQNTGIWFASQYAVGSSDEPLEAFKKDIKTFTWNVPEFEFSHNQSTVSVRVINPRFSEFYALLFASFMEGALKTLGCKITNREVSNGSVRLTALRK